MAKIEEYLTQILSARYGRDVRQSIHDAISAINDESTECWAAVEKVPETLAIAAVKDRVSGKDVTLPLSSDFVATDFKAKGNTEQFTTSGKNLLDCNGLKEQTVAGVTFTPVFDNSGLLEYINVNGANDGTSNSNYHLSAGKFSLTGGKTYKVTGCPSTGSDTTYGFGVSYIGTDFGSGRIGTPAQDYTEAYVSISVFKGVTVSNVKFYPMVRYAENGDDTYEPFTNGASPNNSYTQEIKSVVLSEIKTCGKNLFNRNNPTLNALLDNGLIKENANGRIYAIPVIKGEKYTLSKSIIESEICILGFFNRIPQVGDVLTNRVNLANAKQHNFTATDNYMCLTFGREEHIADDVQVEQSTTATPYEPHTESVVTLSNPITLNGIDDVRDYVDMKDNVEHHKFKYERVLGSNITSVDASEAYGNIIVSNIEGKSKGLSLSNKFIGINYSDRIENTDTFRCYLDENKKLIFRPAISENANFADLATVRAYFDNNEVYAVYELAEPIETPLPEADLEALKNIRTFKGTTHVFTDSEVKPDLEVEYVIDTKLYIDAKFKELS